MPARPDAGDAAAVQVGDVALVVDGGGWAVPVMTAPWLCESYPATQCAAVRIFVGATTAPPQKKPVSSEVSAVPLSSPYRSSPSRARR
ncbi:hypothetical protein SGLAM104S_08498 [Streptomyces glaucescens]